MPLTRPEAQAIINVVAEDALCRHRIQSVFNMLPANWKAGGWVRNTMNQLTYDIGLGVWSKSAWQSKYKNGFISGFTESFPQSNNFQRECCNGIASVTTAAINRNRSKLPFILEANDSQGTTTDYGHYAPKIVMKQGGEYTFDWWMSLDVDNPILWKTKDWLQYPNQAIMNKGIAFSEFRFFS